MSSSLTPGACMEINLSMLYDTAFKYIKQATKHENSNDFVQAQKMYIHGIQSFMTIIKYETNASKQKLIKNNLKEFISKAEKIQQKIKETQTRTITPSAPPIFDLSHETDNGNNDSILIKVPIQAKAVNDCIENESFVIEILYNSSKFLSDITDKILAHFNENNLKYFPKQFTLSFIEKQSFIAQNIYDSDDLRQILQKRLTEYNRYEIISKGLTIGLKMRKYHHKIDTNSIDCKYMTYKQRINPNMCPIYHDTMHKNIFSKNSLNHLRQFSHFKNEYIEKPECKLNQRCPSYIELESGTHRIEDLCHVQLFRHTPRSAHRILKFEKYINAFIINTNWSDNYPIYKPTATDKQKYVWNAKDGFINALLGEMERNGFKSDITNENILSIVEDRLQCLRHKAMGSPLNKCQMMALVLYTWSDCNYELCLSQRKGEYLKWKWFDFCLYFAIFNLSQNETGNYMLFSGLSNVKLDSKEVQNGYFVSYTSATWMRHIAMEFVNGEGMLIQFDESFRSNDKVLCADVSWISPFVDECEVIIARSDIYCNDNFSAKVVDDKNGIQTVYVDKKN